MIVCRRCKQSASITDDNIQPIYDDEGQILRWEHKDCEYNEEESSSWNDTKRPK